MYVDDIVLFSKVSRKDAVNLVWTLEKYCTWSGQAINRSKSGVYFSKHTHSQDRRAIKIILQVKNLKKDAVYLGAPMLLSRALSKDLAFLQDKLETKLLGWRSKCLSWEGRRTLINAVAQSIPTYAMSSFNISNKVCDKLDSLSRRFWWKLNQREGRFLAWKAWNDLCHPRNVGGLGFKKAKSTNFVFWQSWHWW